MLTNAKGQTRKNTTTNIILATGSKSKMLTGLESDSRVILTNREILNLPAVPKSMVIIGAGAVGVEFASIFDRIGTEVTLLEMLPHAVPLEDEEISTELEKSFRKQRIALYTEAR